eukprot:3798505-Pyramimonas_sp.AAC.1
MSAAALPRLAPGQEFRGLGLKVGRSFRASVIRSIWPKGPIMRSLAITMTLLLKGHLIDPVQVSLSQPSYIARRLFSSRGAFRLIEMAKRIWTTDQETQRNAIQGGPIGRLVPVAKALGWSWTDNFDTYTRHTGHVISMTG